MTAEPNKQLQNPINNQYLIIKDPRTHDYKLNFFYLFSQLAKNRRFLYAIFASAILVSLYFALNLSPQYQIISFLSKPNIKDYKNLLSTTELLNNPQLTKELTVQWGTQNKFLFVQYNNTDRPLLEITLFSHFKRALNSSNNLSSFIKSREHDDTKTSPSKKTGHSESEDQLINIYKIMELPDKTLEVSSRTTNPEAMIKEQLRYFSFINHKVVQETISNQQALAQQTIIALKEEIRQAMQVKNASLLSAKQAKLKQIEALNYNSADIKIYSNEDPIIKIIPLNRKRGQIILLGMVIALMVSALFIIRKSNLLQPLHLN